VTDRTAGRSAGPAAAGSAFNAQLAAAAALRWPEPAGMLAAADALWMSRSNDSARRSVPDALQGPA
jgi:DNA polymerase-3 subunit epsilon